jgi:ribonuclease HI
MEKINIMYQGSTRKDTNSSAWAIWYNPKEAQMTRSHTTTNKYQGDNRGSLLAISMALTHIVYCYRIRNAAAPFGTLTIWTPTKKRQSTKAR